MSMGRPTKYNQEIADSIAEKLATSDEGFEHICTAHGISPASGWNWLNSHPDFLEKYRRAREFQTELGFDRLKDVLSAPFEETDVYSKDGAYIGKKVDPMLAMADIQLRKLEVDVIKFKLAKLQPRRFGDNKNVDLNVKVSHNVSSEQYRKLLATAAAPPMQIEGPEGDSEYLDFTEGVTDSYTPDDDLTADEFDDMVAQRYAEDDELG